MMTTLEKAAPTSQSGLDAKFVVRQTHPNLREADRLAVTLPTTLGLVES
ncbi:hypothetical protein ACIBCN_01785 [Nocardia sp. NPDC051052]